MVRIVGLLCLAGIAVAMLIDPMGEARRERRIKEVLLLVQEGLQRYHVQEEIYPKRAMKGGELVAFLHENSHLEDSIVNPWGGGVYHGGNDVDRMAYETDALAESYELTVRYLHSKKIRFRLDSTENQSLE
ncbi:hypothetical protein N9B73_02320 [Verrucomicrobiales bacterium]|nr:hypothetical protein [Verrucomicrobiales bacterium]